MKRVMIVMGTRPEAIKLCPLVRELRRRKAFETLVCSTGQHREMLDRVLSAFSVIPDFNLAVMRKEQTLSETVGRILLKTDELLTLKKPDLVLVQGDTATAYAASAAAFYRHIPIGHVEAGLRTYHMQAPFPEEYHRQAISLIADYHFAPTLHAKQNLIREGKPEASIHVTGNTVVDAMRLTLGEKNPPIKWNFPADKRILVFTAHRRESIGPPLYGMLRALRKIVTEHADVLAFFPVHQNPEVRRAAIEVLKGAPRIRIIDPLDIVSFHHLLSNAYLILTDSGGIQEEAVSLGIPTLVMRYSSERTEGLRAGVLKLVGSGEAGIVEAANRLLKFDSEEYLAMKKPSAVFGDGNACKRIADILERMD